MKFFLHNQVKTINKINKKYLDFSYYVITEYEN